jgi:hypothetical protein
LSWRLEEGVAAVNNSTLLAIWGLLGFASGLCGTFITYMKIRRSQALLLAKIDEAERDLLGDIAETDRGELEETQAGRELLALLVERQQLAKKPWGYDEESIAPSRKAQLGLVAETCRQQYELVGRAINAYAQILGGAAKAVPLESWGISSRRRPEFGFESRDATLSQGLASLQALFLRPTPDSALTDVPLLSQRSALLARLVAELAEFSQLDEVQTCHIKPHGSDGFELRIHCQHIVLDIVCQPGYPSEPPNIVLPADLTFPWTEGMTLKDIVLEAIKRFAH